MWRTLFDILFPPRTDELVLRTVSDDAFATLVAPRCTPATQPSTVTLLPYHNPTVRATVHEAKYHGNHRAFRLLGAALADYLRECDEPARVEYHAVIVPVPLGTARYRARGFNQVEEVVKNALTTLNDDAQRFIFMPDALIRTRETRSQVSLPRNERAENMRDAFVCNTTTSLDPHRTYFVIDDVLTTGATLQAAINALSASGAINISPIAIAHSH